MHCLNSNHNPDYPSWVRNSLENGGNVPNPTSASAVGAKYYSGSYVPQGKIDAGTGPYDGTDDKGAADSVDTTNLSQFAN